MKLNIYATRNKKSGQFGKPDFQVMDSAEIVESYACSFKEAPDDQKILIRELEVYKLGEYDSVIGSIVPITPEFLMDLGALDGKETKEN